MRPALLNRTLLAASAFCLFLMMSITLVDATGRYFFAMPIQGASEIVGLLLGYTIFLAVPVVTRDRGHITVGVLAERLPRLAAALERGLVWAATFGGFGLVTWLLLDQANHMRRGGDLLTYVDLPRYPFVYPLVALAGVTVFVLLLGLRRGGASATDPD